MRLLVFFDLPVKSRKQRQIATRFRNFLLKDGFFMVQFSVYSRICNGVDDAEKHRARIFENRPDNGSVRLIIITEKQYEKMDIIVGRHLPQEKSAKNSGQISFF